MKKIFAIVFVAVIGVTAAYAQKGENADPKLSKRGIPILPKAGDFAIGIDATPFFEYMGNMFNNSSFNDSPFFGNDLGIHGKYFLKDNRAIRATVNLNFFSNSNKGSIPNVFDADDILEDKKTVSKSKVEILAGYEFRRGHGRVQGFWGGEFGFGISSLKTKYDYANKMTNDNNNPNVDLPTVNFGGNIQGTSRVLEDKTGMGFKIGAGAFAGVDYFFAPQICISGEVGIRVWGEIAGKSKFVSESYDGTSVVKDSDKYRNPSDESGKFAFETKPQGKISLYFHF